MGSIHYIAYILCLSICFVIVVRGQINSPDNKIRSKTNLIDLGDHRVSKRDTDPLDESRSGNADDQVEVDQETELLRRSHRDGRRLVTPDPSVNIANFNFTSDGDDDDVQRRFRQSQLSRRRNLRRRLDRLGNANSTKRRRLRQRLRTDNSLGLTKILLYFFLIQKVT